MLSGTQYTPIAGLEGDFSALISKAGSEAEVIREHHGQNCGLAVTLGCRPSETELWQPRALLFQRGAHTQS